MIPLLKFLKESWEHRTLVLFACVILLLALVKRQQDTISFLRSHPTIEVRDRIVEKKVIVRGPVRVVKEVVRTPDGSETTRTVTDRSPETITTDKDREESRVDTPPALPLPSIPTRYVGLSLTPTDWRRPRISAGATLWGRVDAGAYWDSARRLNDGAIGVESRVRF